MWRIVVFSLKQHKAKELISLISSVMLKGNIQYKVEETPCGVLIRLCVTQVMYKVQQTFKENAQNALFKDLDRTTK
jgi:hypothetical protein